MAVRFLDHRELAVGRRREAHPGAVTGARCLPAGECVTLTSADCAANGGTYHGDLPTCNPSPCASSTGACCLANLSCEVEDPDLCSSNGGIYQGDGVPCVPNPCGAATGACCFGDSPDDCVFLSAPQCFEEGGIYLGDGVTCVPNPCTPVSVREPELRGWGWIKSRYR